MEPEEILFHDITLADKGWMDEKFAEDDRNACEYTFANNYIWRKIYRVEVAEVCGCLLIRFWEGGGYCYSYPVGAGDKRAVIGRLLAICGRDGYALRMSPLGDADREQLLEWFPGRFLIEGERDDADYIYSREKLTTLAGKKLHGKRNHIARFKDGGDWSYEPMTGENLEECRTMTYTWMRMRSEKWNEEMEEEVMVLHEAFDHMAELGLVGGVLRRAGEIVAFTMGEPLNSETFVVHFEKAFPDMQGAYPMINQQFVERACQEYTYINREEDTGDPGLRKAKLSYYPEILLTKYRAVESAVVHADPVRDARAVKQIWEVCFGDEEEYIEAYLEHRMTRENMLVIWGDGRPVSMASVLPVQYAKDGAYVEARYVYAVATLPEYRGRGYARRILAFAQENYQMPLILAPAEESLIRYYEQMGFQRAFRGTRREILAGEPSGVSADRNPLADTTDRGASGISADPEPSADVTIQELAAEDDTEGGPAGEAVPRIGQVTAEEYVRLRDEKWLRDGYVRWDEAAVRYAMEVSEAAGGRTATVVWEQDTGCGEQAPAEQKEFLMYGKDGETLNVQETSLTEAELRRLLPYLFAETGTNRAVFGQPAGMLWLPEQMAGETVPKDGYLALTLD